jgi:hypothetical protein
METPRLFFLNAFARKKANAPSPALCPVWHGHPHDAPVYFLFHHGFFSNVDNALLFPTLLRVACV